IENSPEDARAIREILSRTGPAVFELNWVRTIREGAERLRGCAHDVILLDLGLEETCGMETLWRVQALGSEAAIIVLTGEADEPLGMDAVKAGAQDFLFKGQVHGEWLSSAIRHAIQRQRSERELRASEGRLRDLSLQLLTAQENERRRLAAELHDSIAASLSAIKIAADCARDKLGDRRESEKHLDKMVLNIQQTIEEVRRIMADLRPSILDDLGIVATIGWYCREFEKTYSPIRIVRSVQIREEEVPESYKIVLFRLIQESLTNVAKHSAATYVTLALRKSGDRIELTVQDNGQGFDLETAFSQAPPTHGLGLLGMKERTELSGGNYSVESGEGGTVVRAFWLLS
ncbi:MAG TPA: histidine kinase, partial [Thermodesulfobacteriota bacterium]|nr:histidine kinase [Thermodesulfobacteriota bacterium]